MIHKHFRITEEQDRHLRSLSAQTGLNVNELLRLILDNLDDTTLSIALQQQERNQQQKIKVLAGQKYISMLLSNGTNNLNQIAKQINQHRINDYELQIALGELTSEFQNLRGELHEYYQSNLSQ